MTFLQQLPAFLNLAFDTEDLLAQTEEVIWTLGYDSTWTAENHEGEWGLTWYFPWGICTSFPTWTF